MLQSWRKPAQLFRNFNTLQFAGVMGIVLVVMILLLMGDTRPHHPRWVSVDLPKVRQPISMRGADREDAMIVVVTRDGRLYFGREQVTPASLAVKIADHLKHPEVEWKVYIVADARARWGAVKLVLDVVRATGVLRIAILTDQRRSATLHI